LRKKTAQKVYGGNQQPTRFSFTVGTSTGPQTQAASEKEEDKLAFDWSLLKEWAEANLSATSQARMLFESEKKDRMSVEEATSKFVVIKRLLDDELKRAAP
jgi:hypothetical protein